MKRINHLFRLSLVSITFFITVFANADECPDVMIDGLWYHLVTKGSGANAVADYASVNYFPSDFSGVANIAPSATFIYSWREQDGYDEYGRPKYVTRSKYLTGIVTRISGAGSLQASGCPGVTNVNIPNTVTTIADGAFYRFTGLTSITIPNSVINLGEGKTWLDNWNAPGVFMDCANLTSVTLGNSVTAIPAAAFYGCSSLTSITIPNTVTLIGDYAFRGCSGFTSITINSVKSIGKAAFSDCASLVSVTILGSETSIGGFAFSSCSSLRSVTISGSVISIGERAFYDCPVINRVYINDLADWCRIKFSSDDHYKSNPLYCSHRLFLNGREVIDLDIPETVTTIESGAFYSCRGFESVTIPNSVNRIGNYAFYDCTGLVKLTVGDTISNVEPLLDIGAVAFGSCSTLKELSLGNCVNCIGGSTFANCTGLNGNLMLPQQINRIGPYAFENCFGLTSVEIPSSVQTIEKGAFRNCKNLHRIDITDLEAWCRINFGSSLNDYVTFFDLFLNGELITDLVIPNSINVIKPHSFSQCKAIKYVKIPNSVTEIGDGAFSNCQGMETLYLGKSVEYLRSQAFFRCSSLISIYSNSEIAPAMENQYVFSEGPNYNKATVYVPIGSKRDYELTNYWNLFTNIVEMDMNETPPGDTNGDGEVNIADVNAVIQAILGNGASADAYDVNNDGEINIADVNAIINIILNQ